MASVVVDANCIARFQRERLGMEVGVASGAIEHILSNHLIVLDSARRCEHEWFACLQGPIGENLKDWLAEQLRVGTIQTVSCGPQPDHRRRLQQLGFPQKDHKWVCLVVASAAEAMITEDIDFYDPRRKGSPARTTQPIKQNQRGPVATYFKRKLGAVVMMFEHVCDQL